METKRHDVNFICLYLFTWRRQSIPKQYNVKLKTFFIFCSFDFEVVSESGQEGKSQYWAKHLIEQEL